MPAENKFLNLSRDQLRDIGLGIGRGFQAYDPNNPFAGAGAAMEATIASGMAREKREEDLFLALAEMRRKDLEQQRRERREDVNAEKEAEEFDRRLKASEESKMRLIGAEAVAKTSEAALERERQIGLGVHTLEGGFVPSMMDQKMKRDFMDEFPDVPRVSGKPPIDPDMLERELTLRERLEAAGMKVRPGMNRPPYLLER